MKIYRVEPKPHLKLRIIATLVDYGIFFTIVFVYGYIFGEKTEDGWALNGLPALPVPLFWLLYFVVVEAVSQATPGHDICKLKVVTTDGCKITLSAAFKRRICDPIDIFFYGIPGIIAILKSTHHQRLGDMLANTIVVKNDDIKEITLFENNSQLTNI